jgi:hypothetical protein
MRSKEKELFYSVYFLYLNNKKDFEKKIDSEFDLLKKKNIYFKKK